MAGADFAVVLDPRQLSTFLNSEQGPLGRFMIVQGERVKVEAQRRVGVYQLPPGGPPRQRKPGTLRDSIVKRFVADGEGFYVLVGSNDPIALLHHEGTEPHVIRPVRTAALAFWSGSAGTVVFAREVNHPGTQPNRFLTDSLSVLRTI